MIINEGLEKILPEPLQNIIIQTFDLRNFPFDNNAAVTSYRTISGEFNLNVNSISGRTQLWGFACIAAEPFYQIKLTGNIFHVIPEDVVLSDRYRKIIVFCIPLESNLVYW